MKKSELKDEYRDLMAAVTAILFRFDPAALNFGFNSDEYRPEAETIVCQLENCRSEDDVRALVTRELYEWFDEPTSESPKIPEIAAEVWKLIENRNL